MAYYRARFNHHRYVRFTRLNRCYRFKFDDTVLYSFFPGKKILQGNNFSWYRFLLSAIGRIDGGRVMIGWCGIVGSETRRRKIDRRTVVRGPITCHVPATLLQVEPSNSITALKSRFSRALLITRWTRYAYWPRVQRRNTLRRSPAINTGHVGSDLGGIAAPLYPPPLPPCSDNPLLYCVQKLEEKKKRDV